MTQHMGMMDFSEEEDGEDNQVAIGHLKLLPPFAQSLGWDTEDFGDGETTIGRHNEQDLTISDPSVSSSHAVIDIVDLPEAGGKRISLKDLRSMNGTYIVNTDTGAKTRLAPKKATMLPLDDCQIQFGNVMCKVAMGPATAPPDATGEDNGNAKDGGVYDADTQFPEGGAYDANTQLPGAGAYDADTQLPGDLQLDGEDNEDDSEAIRDERKDTEPLRDTEPLAPIVEEVVQSEAAVENGAAALGRGVESADETQQERADAIDVQEDKYGKAASALGKKESTIGAGGSGAVKDAGVDGGCVSAVYEPPTQHMALEMEDFGDDDREPNEDTADSEGERDHVVSEQKFQQDSVQADAAVAEDTANKAATATVNAGQASDTGQDDKAADPDSGDETADEYDTAGLFNTQDEDNIARNTAEASTPVREADADSAAASGSGAARSAGTTLMSPATEPEYRIQTLVMSPGGASDATTLKQESPEMNARTIAGSAQEEGDLAEVAQKEGSTGESEKKQGGILKRGESLQPRADVEQDENDADDGDGNDGSSDSSGALIPGGQDLSGFEDELEGAGSDNEVEDTNAEPKEERAAAPAVNSAADEVGRRGGGGYEAAEQGSGSETDATEVDSVDEGAADVVHPESPSSTRQNSRHIPHASPRGDGVGGAAASNGDRGDEASMTPGEVRSPGGTLLRRTTTEDAMQAIAREQQRAEAARAAAAVARIGASEFADESDDSQEADEPQTEMDPSMAAQPAEEVDAIDEPAQEPETQAMAFETDADELMLKRGTNGDGDDSDSVGEDEEDAINGGTATAFSAGTSTGAAVADSRTPPAKNGTGGAGIPLDMEVEAVSPQATVNVGTDEPTQEGAASGSSACQSEEVSQDAGDDPMNVHDDKELPEGANNVVASKNVEEGLEASSMTNPAQPIRSSGRRRTRTKAFDEIERSDPANTATSPKQVDETDMSPAKSGKRRRPSEMDSKDTMTTEASSPNRVAANRGRRSSLSGTPQAAAITDEPATVQKAPRQSPRKRMPTYTRQESPRQLKVRAGGLPEAEGSADEAIPEEQKAEEKSVGPGGQRRKGRNKRKASLTEDAKGGDEDDKDRADATGVAETTTNSSTTRASKKRRMDDGGISAGGKHCRDARRGDDGVAPMSTRRGRQAAQGSGRITTAEAGTVESSLEPSGGAADVSRSKGSKGKGEELTPAPTPSKRGKPTPSKAATAAGSSTPSKASNRGRKKSSPPSPVAAAFSGRSASIESIGGNPEEVKVCFTSLAPGKTERDCIKKLGVSEVENVVEATHLVAGGKGVPFKRTPKLLAGIGRCRFVVDVDWLHQSAEKRQVLDGMDYVLCDTEAEKKFGFKMRTSLGVRKDGGLLKGFSVHVDPAVAGTKGMRCPPADEMKMVVESAGGTWLKQIPKKGGVPDPESLLVISHPNALAASGTKGSKSRATAACGRGGRAYLPEMVFLCILRQGLSWPDELAVGGEVRGAKGGGSASAKKSAQKPKSAKRRR